MKKMTTNGDKMTEEKLPLCECGCGLRVTKHGNRFIHGHHRRGISNSPEHNAAISEALTDVSHTPEHNAAISKGKKGILNSPEHNAAISKGLSNNDLVNHHYLYDHSDLLLNTVKITRSDHMKLHRLLQKLKYIVPHINVKEI